VVAAVFRGVMLHGFFGVVRRVSEMPVGDVRVVPGLHVIACFMMLRGFTVMLGRVLMVLGCLVMMRSAFVVVHVFVSPW